MDKAKKKFGSKREIYGQRKAKELIEANSKKNIENELIADDNEAGAPASSAMFETKKIEDDVDYTEGGTVT
jgi:hypothetical protein